MNPQEHRGINTCNKIYDSFKAISFFGIKQHGQSVRLSELEQSRSQIAVGYGHSTAQQHVIGKNVMKMRFLAYSKGISSRLQERFDNLGAGI